MCKLPIDWKEANGLGRSRETQLLLTVNDFAENLNKNEQTDIAF